MATLEGRQGRQGQGRAARRAALLVALLALVAALARAGARPQDELVHLVVLHTNDVHGQVLAQRASGAPDSGVTVGGLPRVAAEVAAVRAELAALPGAGLLVLDAGDWFQGTVEGMLDDGLPFVRALVAVGYDALCVGNHELDRGRANLERILAGASPPAVLANVRDRASGARLGSLPRYRIFERAALRIAVVGLLTPETPEITHHDARALEFQDPAQALAEVRAELALLRPPVDLVVPLAHDGIELDRALARAHPDLALIVGGHSHTFLREGVRQGDTLIVQAGAKAAALGRVDLWFDRAAGRVVEARARLIDLYAEPIAEPIAGPIDGGGASAEVARACAELVRRAAVGMDDVVGTLAAPLVRGRGHSSSSAGNWITDVMRARAGADVAIQNRGGIRADLPAGPVKRRDLVDVLPFGNTLVSFSMSGADLEQVVRRAVERPAHSGIEVSGLVLRVLAPRPGEELGRLDSIRVAGERVDPARSYRVATNSFLAAGGDAYFTDLARADERDHGLALRDLLEDALRAGEPISPSDENRYESLPGAGGAPQE